jgi:predicted membrane-bound spermidine synthase
MFFLSGVCALLYQVVWTRLAFAAFGVVTPVLSVVVSVFMLGLGAGSLLGGAWAGALPAERNDRALVGYAVVEAITGLGGWAVPHLFSLGRGWLGSLGATDSGSYLAASAIVIAFSLLPWTIAMGATFPLAIGFLRGREGGTGGFGALYLANVLGALAGVLGSSYLLLEVLGFSQTLVVAVTLNLTLALAALAWWHKARKHGGERDDAVASAARGPAAETAHLPWAATVLFLTGFVAMAEEVAWFRTFTVFLGTEVYAFASLLAVYLAATAAGSAAYRLQRRRGRDVPPWRLLPYLAPAAILPLVLADQRLHPGSASVLASLVPFCLLLGYQTPSILDRFGGDRPRAVGRLYAGNVAGCILGPLAASYLLLPALGERWTLALLPALLAMAAFTVDRQGPARLRPRWPALVAVASCVVAGLAAQTYLDGFAHQAGVRYEVRRDVTGTATAIAEPDRKALLVNGIGMTALMPVTKMMAHLPSVCLGRPPRRSLAICFGMGTTFRSLTTWGPVDVVELVPSVPSLFGFFHADAAEVLRRPGARIVIDDGRRFLARSRDTYDIITIDPPPPLEAAGSSLLYSREFYRAAQARLAEDGILAQWAPSGETAIFESIYRTLRDVFPNVLVFRSRLTPGHHFLASRRPMVIPNAEQAVHAMPPAAVRDLVEWNPETHPVAMFAMTFYFQLIPSTLPSLAEGGRITDDQPFNEYTFLRRHLSGEP